MLRFILFIPHNNWDQEGTHKLPHVMNMVGQRDFMTYMYLLELRIQLTGHKCGLQYSRK